MHSKADKFAAGLANLGLQKGDHIGIWMPNKLNWYIAMMGIARLGGICVALNPAYQTPEIEYCIKKVGIKAMITTETFKTQNYHKMLAEICPEMQSSSSLIENENYTLKRVIVDSNKRLSGSLTMDEVCKVSESEIAAVQKLQSEIDADDVCNIQFTSGTTGKPKAALLSHFNMINNALMTGKRSDFSTGLHKVCLNVPFFHTFGTNTGIVMSLINGATLYLPNPGFNPAASVDCILKHGCTDIFGTPTMFYDLLNHVKQANIKLRKSNALIGGASPSPQLLLDLEKYLGIVRTTTAFGMTETSPVSFLSTQDEPKDLVLEYVGKVLEHVEAKVVDNNGKTVPFGCVGELWVRGSMNMIEYYGDTEKTNETITPDKWLKTGDQFILYENGYGKIVGRLKEMIKRGGETIFPKEIEDFLSTHPDIQEVYVVGVPDERMGEEIAAFIKMVPNQAELNQENIKSFCKGKLAHFKIPRYVRIVAELPKTVSGKIQQFKLVEDFD